MKTLFIKSKYVLVTVQTVTKLEAFFAALWIENGPCGPRPPGRLNDRGKLFAEQKNDTEEHCRELPAPQEGNCFPPMTYER